MPIGTGLPSSEASSSTRTSVGHSPLTSSSALGASGQPDGGVCESAAEFVVRHETGKVFVEPEDTECPNEDAESDRQIPVLEAVEVIRETPMRSAI